MTNRTNIPRSTGALHFIGIGGIGMSGIAEILHNLGYIVQGSDAAANANTQRLAALGITIFIGQHADNIKGAAVVVPSSAIKPDNVELQAAKAALLPVVPRAEMLAELVRLRLSVAIAGTHGKTTTTTMVASLLEAGGIDPTVINGGIINAYGSNTKLGKGDWVVVEADESDGTFLKLLPTYAIVTNIDPEHLDHYGSFEAAQEAFCQFMRSVPFYGAAVVCLDHPVVQSLLPRIQGRKVITYGFNPQAAVRGVALAPTTDGTRFAVEIGDERIDNLFLPMVGAHNVQNSLAAIAVAKQLGLSADAIRAGLAQFSGVKRRFTKTGEAGGVTVIDDYGHHPVEIAAVLAAARQVAQGRVVAVFQPHRYSRLHDLWDDFARCFHGADTVLIAPVYGAGEQPIDGVDSDALVAAIRHYGHKDASVLESPETLAARIKECTKPGDYVVCLGAGNITQWAHALPKELGLEKRG